MSASKETIVRINITMPEQFHEQVKAFAEKNQRSVSAQIRYVLEQAMKRDEFNAESR